MAEQFQGIRDQELREASTAGTPGFEYPSRTAERNLIQQAEWARSEQVRDSVLNELARRRAEFENQYELEREWATARGEQPLGVDPYDPRQRHDKYAEWLAKNYGTEQERNLDTRRYGYSNDLGDQYGLERDMAEAQERATELNNKTGTGMTKNEVETAKRQNEDERMGLWREWMKTEQGKESYGLPDRWAEAKRRRDEMEGQYSDPETQFDKWFNENYGIWGPEDSSPFRTLEEPKKPTGRSYPLVKTKPGPKGLGGTPSYFDTYEMDEGVGRVQGQSEINYKKLLNAKKEVKPSKGGKFVPMEEEIKKFNLGEQSDGTWRSASPSQVNARLNDMEPAQQKKVRKMLGI